jgi:hypothetical protein
MKAPCEICQCPTESGEYCPQCGGEVVTLDDSPPAPSRKPFVVKHGGLEYHVEPDSGWCRVYDPENEGCWADKGPAVELLPESLRWLVD